MKKVEELSKYIDTPIFRLIGECADRMGVDAYVVGGYVRDLLLGRPSKDIDIVSVGKGIDLAKAFAKAWGKGVKLSVFANFGTAQVKKGEQEIEFVGARKESYRKDSRNPIVEDGTLEEDQERRDFTINAMALCLNAHRFGELLDPFYGLEDLQDQILATPLDPDVTFSDDPLRMMRGIRFAAQLGFMIEEDTFEAIRRNAERIQIVSMERITVEMNRIMLSPRPSIGLELLEMTGLLKILLPELMELKGVESKMGIAHKENLSHSFAVVDNLAKHSDNLYLRWAALLHDVGKPQTKRFDNTTGWTFHNHDYVGGKMIPRIFKRLKLPLDGHLKYVQKMVQLHMRPSALADEGITDSAVRRLLFEAGEDIDDLMLLVEADITGKNNEKVKRYLNNYRLVRQKLRDIEEKDRIRNFKPPISGEEIMTTFALGPCRQVGQIKEAIKDAILDGKIPNEYTPARDFMLRRGAELGLQVVANPTQVQASYPEETKSQTDN